MATPTPGPFRQAFDDLRSGALSRRAFLRRAAALGVAAPVALAVAQAVAPATAAAPAPAGARLAGRGQAGAAPARPAEGTDGQTRGAAGELRLLQWQAPSQMGAHAATSTKDQLAAALVSESLMNYLPDGTLLPNLVDAVPSVENGLLAPDLTAVTYRLLPGLRWNDGTPFTARDVAFTWRWLTDPANAATSLLQYDPIADVQAPDDLTVRLAFKTPQVAWFVPFTGTYWGAVYPEHVLAAGPQAATSFAQAPVGTGPYLVESFAPNDQAVFVPNPHYREPTKPAFERVNLKGGGDAASAAQAVLQTGDWDFAWNVQVEPRVLEQLQSGGQGRVVVVPGASIERILFNFSDPNTEVNGQRSQWQTPHPFLTDRAVREALSLATDRQLIVEQFYLPGELPATGVLLGLPGYQSANTAWAFDPDRARQILDAAGWTGDGVRAKDGVELRLAYATSVSSVRQKTQQVIKQAWEDLGVAVELRQVDSTIFFDGAPGNEQNHSHFYADVEMYTDDVNIPYPAAYMAAWYSGGGRNIAQRENGWSGRNYARYTNPDYDATYEAALAATDPAQVAELFVRLNDILIADFAVIPLVQRAVKLYAAANTLRDANVAPGSFETLYWNIANWNRTQ